MITHVLSCVKSSSPVKMTASTLVKSAIQRSIVRSLRELTIFVRRNAVDRTRHVVTHVWVPVTATIHVRFAMNHVRFAAITHAAVKSDKSLACHVLKIALDLVHSREMMLAESSRFCCFSVEISISLSVIACLFRHLLSSQYE